jgi:hypothetical protein
MVSFADSSYANNSEQTSQLGNLVVPEDGTDVCTVAHHTSYKYRRVIRSILSSELDALVTEFDSEILFDGHDLEIFLNVDIAVQRSLF